MIQDIRKEHERLESMKTTQSAKIMAELKSDAHKHRGVLLDELHRRDIELDLLHEKILSLEAEISEIWNAEDPEPV